MKKLMATIMLSALLGCNTKEKNQEDKDPSSVVVVKDSLPGTSALSDQHREAGKNIIGTWRIFKDISRDGDKCDSIALQDGTCKDKNSEMISVATFAADGKYTIKSGFTGNEPADDNGSWKIIGTAQQVDLLLLESHTQKDGPGPSANNVVARYIIQNCSIQQLVLIDAVMFNTMYFIPGTQH